jgi:hypothetical protein
LLADALQVISSASLAGDHNIADSIFMKATYRYFVHSDRAFPFVFCVVVVACFRLPVRDYSLPCVARKVALFFATHRTFAKFERCEAKVFIFSEARYCHIVSLSQ